MSRPKNDGEPVLIRFDTKTYERIHKLKTKTGKPFAEIVRRCVNASFDKVSRQMEAERDKREADQMFS